MRTLVLDLTECSVLPRWRDHVTTLILPVQPGRHKKHYDLRGELLNHTDYAAIKAAVKEKAKEQNIKADWSLPVGFNTNEIPTGAKIYETEWPVDSVGKNEDADTAVMHDALLDDLRRQNLALKAALREAAGLLGRWMYEPTLESLRKKWANLIGEEL